MRILIAPAKKMKVDTDSFLPMSLPQFLPQAAVLLRRMQEMDYRQLKALWKCNDAIAAVSFEQVARGRLTENLTPAILSYQGIQYQYMAPHVFAHSHLQYIKEHLRILSGFYGLLRPFDGVIPYRLEMQAKLAVGDAKNLYGFWKDKLAHQLCSETDVLLNLASKEYSKAITPYLTPKTRFFTCIFGEKKEGKIIEKGTLCKMARGEMVRWLAEEGITDPYALPSFRRLGYAFSKQDSTDRTFVFLKEADSPCRIS